MVAAGCSRGDASDELTFSQPVACRLGPMRFPGTPPVFYSSTRNRLMPTKPTPSEFPTPDDNDPTKQHARIDIDPPYRADSVLQFRKLLAELIARRITAIRHGLSNSGDEPKQ